MKNHPAFLAALAAVVLFLCASAGCRHEFIENEQTLRNLYQVYKNGEIRECQHNGQAVFMASLNAYDAGSSVFDKDGNAIGTCNPAYGQADPICNEITGCQVIYRVKNNIWGLPAVDKYGLGQ